MRIWIFGQSMSTPYGLSEEQGWPYLLSQTLNAEYTNFAQPAADNLFIYHTFLENYQKIKSIDLVIIGWSHPSRKSFIFDSDNAEHQKAVDGNLKYITETQTFFRSCNARSSDKIKWQSMLPTHSGKKFYDQWFADYYSEYEQQCNFQAYTDSVQSKVIAPYIPFYFSKESVNNVTRQNDNFMLDFIIDNNVAIDTDDCHLNEQGHQLWTDLLISQIKL